MTPSILSVLVVDDNQDVRDSMVMVLELLGCQARAVETAEEALSVLGRGDGRPVNLAFVDVSLPGMSGFDLAKTLRPPGSAPLSMASSAMLVAMTGWGSDDDRDRAIDAGFDEHVVKPLDMTRLQALLEAAQSCPRSQE